MNFTKGLFLPIEKATQGDGDRKEEGVERMEGEEDGQEGEGAVARPHWLQFGGAVERRHCGLLVRQLGIQSLQSQTLQRWVFSTPGLVFFLSII